MSAGFAIQNDEARKKEREEERELRVREVE